MAEVFIARQPIYDRDLTVVGYELLYRDGLHDRARIGNDDLATTEVLLNTYLDIGFEDLVGSCPAFINISTAFIAGVTALPIAPEQVVVEIRCGAPADRQLLKGLGRLREQGYTIALDGHQPHRDDPGLLALADMVKINVAGLPRAQLEEQLGFARDHGLHTIAQRVEDQDEFDRCLELGFDGFQGFFFARPRVVSGNRLPSNRVVVMELLARLQHPDVSFGELEKVIAHDVSLTYALLRYINCASYGLRREIESVNQAVMLLGLRAVRDWATLLLLRRSADGKPSELMKIGLIRARMCERLSGHRGDGPPEQAFTVGLLSILDAVMDTPMDLLLDAVPLSGAIKLALLDLAGPHGETLRQVLTYEHGDWGALPNSGDQRELLTESYLEAVKWAEAQGRALAE